MEQKCFWVGWLVTLATTGLLLLWSLPLAPFATPGMLANEAVIVFFPVMLLRWIALATLLYWSTLQWCTRLSFSTQWCVVSIIAVLLLHLVLGVINLGILNLWLSVLASKTRTTEIVCVVIYFGLPLAVLGICTVGRFLSLPQSR
ncbi:hypothetical protein K9N68_39745 (plasmid) [Kovacikia minuta CCNUW1]|uniref:hypothetical protein n=1 Tax=Kovacikia minuta TaxID=2931930 RepID=UPI001CCDFBB5|nr:hypothetical protein [Kovacikia minuta]UBF30789.1 hypothetical protein K9N68_39745 [Kovacikia minuta CCNUW1]